MNMTGLARTRKAILAGALASLGLTLSLGAQSNEPEKFEVASIRPSGSANNRMALGPTPEGGFRATNIPLTLLIAFAYDLPLGKDVSDYVTGLPGWAKS